ncbi:MAG: hypothetical protein IPL26_05565 [Leptospiraceae bacterium]|nr:hypothetical protein [Leptospiraceae bacterium]
MKVTRIKLLSVTFLVFLTNLFSENLSIHSKYEPSNQSAWHISNNFDNSANYTQTILIPFRYPLEASLIPNAENRSNLIQSNFNPNENTGFITYRGNNSADNIYYARDKSTRMPSYGQSQLINTSASGVVFVYLKKNLGLNLDLSMRMMGNEAGQSIIDSMTSNMVISYKLSDNIFQWSPKYNLNFVLQFSNFQYVDDRVVAKKLDFNKSNLRSQFVSSGFTLNTKSVMFEGLIRLPVQQQAIFDIDGLLRPELQGRLGMKWQLPEFIKP